MSTSVSQLLAAAQAHAQHNLRATFFTKAGSQHPRTGQPHPPRHLYPKHLEFMAAGREYKQRLFLAGNRTGKSLAAGYELTCHLTGEYPPWWRGRRFDAPTDWWVAGVTHKDVREVLQDTLLGRVGEPGTGLIPLDRLDLASLKAAKKAATGISSFKVRHANGGLSNVTLKSYQEGREAFQGTTRSIWLDEEPPLDIYTECLLRTLTGGNILMLTFTPLKGISETILNFLSGAQFHEGPLGADKYVVQCGWADVPHLDAAEQANMLASIPEFQRLARTAGIPQLGAGAIYPIPLERVVVPAFEVPKAWPRWYALDVGWNWTAAAWLARNPATGETYVTSTYKEAQKEPALHALAIKARGPWLTGAIDPAANGRAQHDGQQLKALYELAGLKLVVANNAVEAGLHEVWQQLSTGQLKFFEGQRQLEAEYTLYRRDEKGRVVKQNDHLLDCVTGDTLVWTSRGQAPIAALVGDEGWVASTEGWARYERCELKSPAAECVRVKFASGHVDCTPDHLFLTPEGWVEARHLAGRSVLNTPLSPQENLCPQPAAPPPSKHFWVWPTTGAESTLAISGKTRSGFTSAFGSTTMALFRQVTTFITSTMTVTTTALKTWRAYLVPATYLSTIEISGLGRRRPSPPSPLGTGPQRAAPSPAAPPRWPRSPLASGTRKKLPAASAAPSFTPFEVNLGSAAKAAGGEPGLASAGPPSAGPTPLARGAASRCLSVEAIGLHPVYCLDVPATNAFAAGPGVIIHNCVRYAINTPGLGRTEAEATGRAHNPSPPRAWQG